jgi:hypothetical protein
MRTRILSLYVAAVVAGAVVAPLGLERGGFLDRPALLILILALSLLGGTRALRIPRLRVQLTAADIFLFCSLLALSPAAAPLVALFGVLGAQLGPERRPMSIRFVFNLATVSLAASLAAGSFSWLGSLGTELHGRSLRLLAAAVVFVAVNLLLVSLVVRIEKGQAVLATCRQLCPTALVGTLTSALVGLGLAAVLLDLGAAGLVLGLLATGPLVGFYREQRARLESRAQSRQDSVVGATRTPALS